jgi:hypothetical protein
MPTASLNIQISDTLLIAKPPNNMKRRVQTCYFQRTCHCVEHSDCLVGAGGEDGVSVLEHIILHMTGRSVKYFRVN